MQPEKEGYLDVDLIHRLALVVIIYDLAMIASLILFST